MIYSAMYRCIYFTALGLVYLGMGRPVFVAMYMLFG